VIYFNDYSNLQPENHASLPDQNSSEVQNLIEFPAISSSVGKATIGKYVDMLMQMPDPDYSDRPLINEKEFGHTVCHQKLAETLLDKEIL